MRILTLLFLVGMTFFAKSQSKPNTKYGDNISAGKYADIRGFKMYYEIYGTGRPLLLIHGNSGSITDMSNQIEFFSKKYQVIIADSRDHGKSLDTLHMNDSLSYNMMTDDYNALLDYLKVDSAFVIGWSDGGINGILLAMNYPKKVKKLVATGANLWSDTSAIDPFVYNVFKMQYARLQNSQSDAEHIVMRRHFRLVMTEPNISAAQLNKVVCPTLIVAGDHDAVKVQHTGLIARSIPNSNLWIVPDAGHGLMVLQYKDKFNIEVNDFFDRPFKKIQGFGLFNN